MDQTRIERIDELFLEAREQSVEERTAFLDRQCGGDEVLRQEIQKLLEVDTAGFLDLGRPSLPRQIGPYRILRELGQGGMGVVFLAEQVLPVRRQVALKVIRRGLLNPEILARFESEKQALALMSHSAIAKVFDAGTTDEGIPFFAMEYVEGLPITELCDREKLSLGQRLRLFIEICEGVQHAHQKGIIHRDIKSTNILVAREDGRLIPKIIDFGIAKALHAPLTPGSMETQLGSLVGTPDCMSPEQLDSRGQDIDTRSDVYSLGVLLFELLVGVRPFDCSELRSAGIGDMLRVLKEDPVPPPSMRLAALGPTGVKLAAGRGTELRPLLRAIRGDLDGIALKALEKDRDRRYPSASELAADIRRHLADEPVLARAPGVLYRFGRFTRRHKAAVTATLMTTAALMVGLVAAGIGFLRARNEAETSKAVTEYLVKIFRLAEPEQSEGATITAREILDRQVKQVRNDWAGNPGVQGRVMRAMGEAYTGLGLYKTAIPLLEEALPKLESTYGQGSEEYLSALNELGNLSREIEDFDRARRYYATALDKALRLVGGHHRYIATIQKNLGEVNVQLGDLETARRQLQAALDLQIRCFGPESGAEAKTLSSLAALELKAGHPGPAVNLAERSLKIRKGRYEAQDPAIGFGHFSLGEAHLAAHQFDRAHADFEAARAILETAYGADHAKVGECLFRLAQTDVALNEKDEAYRLYRRSREINERAFDSQDPRLAPTLAEWLTRYAPLLRDLGRQGEAAATEAAAKEIRAQLSLRSPTPGQ